MSDLKDYKKNMDGQMYFCPSDEYYVTEQNKRKDLIFELNHMKPSQMEGRREIYEQIFESVGEQCYIEPPFYANCGGMFTNIGHHFYANFGLTLVDDGSIYIGDNVLLGPNVMIITTGHPLNPAVRKTLAQFSEPVTIGNNVWIGGDVVILPGVTIGDNAVIGAHSTVSKDIPANCIAVGSPCKVLREINEHDMEYYFKDKKIPEKFL